MAFSDEQDCERFNALQLRVQQALQEADKLGLTAVAIDLDSALNRLRESQSMEGP